MINNEILNLRESKRLAQPSLEKFQGTYIKNDIFYIRYLP